MKRLILFFMLSLWASLSTHSAFAAEGEKEPDGSSMPKEMREVTDFYERRIRQSVQDFLGPQTRAVVTVFVKGKVSASVEPVTTVDEVMPKNVNWLLVGPYFPAPSESITQQSGTVQGNVRIDSAEVSIQVESAVGPELRSKLAMLAKSAFRDVPVKTSVEASLPAALAVLDPSKDPANPAAESKRSPASVDSPKETLENDSYAIFAKRFGAYVPLLAAFVLLLGVFAIASGLRGAAREITEGLKTIKPAGGGMLSAAPMRQAITQSADSSQSRKELPGPRGGAISHSSPVEGRRNIQVLEKYLREAPNLILRSLGDGPEDMLGLSYLVSRMSPESNALLKGLLGIEKLVKLNSYRAGDEVVGFDVNGWVQHLVERVEVKRLAGGDVIEESVTPDQSALLSNAGEEHLLQAAIELNQPAVWRVVSDFVSSDFLRRGGHGQDDLLWMGLVRGSRVTDPTQVRSAVRDLVEKVRTAASENAIQLREKIESRAHFSNRILPFLIESVMEREFGDDDRIVGQVVAEMPDFAELIYERIWTPRRLDDVTDAAMKEIFLGGSLDNERRAYLLFALPETQARRLEGLMSEGTMKKIVLDMAARLRTTADADKKASIRNWVREFLEAVRVQSLAGRIELKSNIKAAPRQTVSEVVDFGEPERKAS